MKNVFVIVFLLFISVITYNCSTDDSGSTVSLPDPDPDANPNPNKTTTYTADVKAIMDAHCIECHGSTPTQGAPMALSNYAELIDAITRQQRDVIGRMETTGRNVMPPAGRLSQEIIDIMLDWEADGRLE